MLIFTFVKRVHDMWGTRRAEEWKQTAWETSHCRTCETICQHSQIMRPLLIPSQPLGWVQLHLPVTGQHTALSIALCFNYFSLFFSNPSLHPYPVACFLAITHERTVAEQRGMESVHWLASETEWWRLILWLEGAHWFPSNNLQRHTVYCI